MWSTIELDSYVFPYALRKWKDYITQDYKLVCCFVFSENLFSYFNIGEQTKGVWEESPWETLRRK